MQLKLALGHHRDDILETLFLNLFYGGKLKAMSPKLINDSGQHIVIRPLAYCKEKDLEAYADAEEFQLFLVIYADHRRIYSVR